MHRLAVLLSPIPLLLFSVPAGFAPNPSKAATLVAGARAATSEAGSDSAAPATQMHPLQPHRAIYSMSLARQVHSEVTSAEGQVFYSIARSCEGWTVENRTLLRLTYDNSSETSTIWSFASWESADGKRFRFRTRYDQDGENVEKLEGEAEMPAGGAPGAARFSLPPDRIIDLPAGTLFPTEHVRQLIAEAERGGRLLNRVVFDGASLENPYLVNALFGPLAEGARRDLARAHALAELPAWWTQLAFFPTAGDEQLPEFEMSAQYRADGIADHIIQHFDQFALDVRLKSIELLPQPDC